MKVSDGECRDALISILWMAEAFVKEEYNADIRLCGMVLEGTKQAIARVQNARRLVNECK